MLNGTGVGGTVAAGAAIGVPGPVSVPVVVDVSTR
jgi:hypothetical protein